MLTNRAFDRSRREASESCLRKRYWGYEYNGTGIESGYSNVYLSTGSAIHHGLQLLLQGTGVEGVVACAFERYNLQIDEAPLATIIGESTPLDVVIGEQQALICGLIRAWALVRLPDLLSEWDTLAVEQERVYQFTSNNAATSFTFMVRTDVEQRSKRSGLIHIRDFKTVGNIGEKWRRQFRYDTLTLSQVLPVEEFYKEKLGGVIIEGICKGERLEWPKGSGVKHQNSPLIYAWFKDGEEPDFQGRWEWVCQSEHILGNGRACPGNKTHTRNGYRKVFVADAYPGGVAGWVEHLYLTDPELLKEQFIELPSIIRNDWEIAEWQSSVVRQEAWVAVGVEAVGRDEELLATHFPKSTSGGKCIYCSFNAICFGNASPDDLTLYKPRTFNHSTEKEIVSYE